MKMKNVKRVGNRVPGTFILENTKMEKMNE